MSKAVAATLIALGLLVLADRYVQDGYFTNAAVKMVLEIVRSFGF